MTLVENIIKWHKTIILLTCLILSIAAIILNGIQLGIDFKGGVAMFVEFEHGDKDLAAKLQRRLDLFGLKDIKVIPFGDKFVYIEIGGATDKDIEYVKKLLKHQGVIEMFVAGKKVYDSRYDGPLVVSDSRVLGSSPSYVVQIIFEFIKPEAYKKWALSTRGNVGRLAAIYLDRKDIPIYFSDYICQKYDNSFGKKYSDIFKDVGLKFACNLKEAKKLCKTYGKIYEYGVDHNIPDCNTIKYPVNDLDSTEELKKFLKNAVGLYDFRSLRDEWSLESETPIVMITSGIQDKETAEKIKNYLESLLQSQEPIPKVVKITEPEKINSEEGFKLLSSFIFVGLIVILIISAFIYLRYRNKIVSLSMIFTMICETILILGFAAWTGWKLDIGAVIGLICAIGTGVDTQIIIAGEYLRSSMKVEAIEKSFGLVYLSAFCLLAVTLPLFIIAYSIPKIVGFALTTTVGILIGILITRPAYAEILKNLLGNEKEKL